MRLQYFAFLFLFNLSLLAAENVVWNGEVDSNGVPSSFISLELGKTYQIRASGTMNLGKWWQDGKPLNEDACYEFNPEIEPIQSDFLKNSMNVPFSVEGYNPKHVYLSKPFVAKQNGIHFWISDIDYSDNTGILKVEIIQQ